MSGFDLYAQSDDRTADERHVLDLLEGWKIAMALLPASSGAKRKPLVTAPFDATAARQYVSATAFKTGQAPLEQSDLVALSEALSAMSVWRRAKQAVPGETYAPVIAFSAPPNLAGLHLPTQTDHEQSFEDFCASFPPWPDVAPPVAARPILTLSELLASPTLNDAINMRHVGELCAGVGTMSRSHRDLGAVPKVLIELDASDRAFLDSVFPSVDGSYGDFFAYDWMTSTTASLLSVFGGISCVLCSDAGRALGARDERSHISTFALPFVANHFRAPFADFENVVGIARADNGSVLHALDAHFALFNYFRTPRVLGNDGGLEIVRPSLGGSPGIGDRAVGHYELEGIDSLIGPCPTLEVEQSAPLVIADILDVGPRDPSLIMRGTFHAVAAVDLSNTRFPVTAGTFVFGGADVPVALALGSRTAVWASESGPSSTTRTPRSFT